MSQAEVSSDPVKSTYSAQCHCGDIRFTVAIPSLEDGSTKVNRCNCSICTKKGYWLVYPLRTDVRFTHGGDKMKSYFFGSKVKPHKFCGECGTSILIDFGHCEEGWLNKKLAVSIRTFDNIEDIMDDLQYQSFDGKHKIGEPFKPGDKDA
ncbi:hypothetical protein EJ08DRAFT_732320 [Tothia fuscella]|uniref:CENP-V/GFA domain-containing protein n=1 Tax=Tothia fuscella TaxID=1048955 RepID=A0A9P4NWG6_9PEZI|nr:hypothetical protein EJ08DRAFT_732320 [Tothia fuscella]